MVKMELRERIKNGVLLLDGAMGTQLIARGIELGRCNDYLNIESPDVVFEVHRSYFEAGSDAVLTNTFGANKYALERHGFAEKVAEINQAGAKIAREAAGKDKYVLGDIGPSGDFLEPVGELKAEALKEAFAEQARGLLDGGVDGFIIETMTALNEMEAAIEGVKSVGRDVPVFASMAFDSMGDGFRTMMGIDSKTAVSKLISFGVEAVGFNCGKMSLEDYVELAGRCVAAVGVEDVAVLGEPNAGLPELVEGQAVYNISSDDFAEALEKIHLAGVSILGGCCGTGPADIKAVAKKLRKSA